MLQNKVMFLLYVHIYSGERESWSGKANAKLDW